MVRYELRPIRTREQQAIFDIENATEHAPDEVLASATNSKLRRYEVAWLLARNGGVCALCGGALSLNAELPVHHPERAQLDHRVPGVETWGNVQPAHGKCNALKNDGEQDTYTPAEYAHWLSVAVDEWNEPTLESLDRQIAERLQWVERANGDVARAREGIALTEKLQPNSPQLAVFRKMLAGYEKTAENEQGKLDKLYEKKDALESESGLAPMWRDL